MIFSVEGHIEKILNGTKVQTRRQSLRYCIGKSYAIQPKRASKAIPDGRIRIINIQLEFDVVDTPISENDALAEGGYNPEEYESLYEKLNPKWLSRFAYTFKFEPSQTYSKDEKSKEIES